MNFLSNPRLTVLKFAISVFGICVFSQSPTQAKTGGSLASEVTKNYIKIAQQRYSSSLKEVKRLSQAIQMFVSDPSEETQELAKETWIEAHSVYSTTEVFRFGNPNVDAWEGKVNSWPVDEGFIDYVNKSQYEAEEGNPHSLENIIGNSKYVIEGGFIEEAQGGADPKAAPKTNFTDSESNVATGFHVIEFLLWGQDLNENPTASGERSYTDYLTGEECTNGNCERRKQYLLAASRILVRDLEFILADWGSEQKVSYGKTFVALSLEEQLRRMIVGMGSLSFGELAGERMQVALLASDQEDEQNCFSDTTHLAIYYNVQSISSLYLGVNGKGKEPSKGSLSSLVRKLEPELDERLQSEFIETEKLADELLLSAKKGDVFDQLILAGNIDGKKLIEKLIKSLEKQTVTLEILQNRVGELATH